ncbi:hypothetical protein J8J14_02230 [Roseomonas sp. SSH11]|uniref:Uncharacterized protein n=1 Tax=Pararoseomonas baculiformis TaxID=2820812 RepID=A0ABS4A9A2_9PROT|nr:hypothetical protein [Pararoseomonas baculiformis]MBP0443584.1 hypothetical protein [Pararoseomonas baculiformis]
MPDPTPRADCARRDEAERGTPPAEAHESASPVCALQGWCPHCGAPLGPGFIRCEHQEPKRG